MQTSGFAARVLARALALVLAVAVPGCSSSSGPDDFDFGTNDPNVIVGLGDSITFGVYDTGVESCDEQYRGAGGFCPRLAARNGKTVINEGVCGETSYDGVNRINDVLLRYRPGVILIDYGVNDLFHSKNAILEDLRIMVDVARQNKTMPVLGTLVPATGDYAFLNPSIEDINRGILELCKKEDIECADHWQTFTTYPDFTSDPYTLLYEDGLHPNATGYQLMANTWSRSLRNLF